MSIFTVKRLPEKQQSFTNTLLHNPKDFNNNKNIHVKINGYYLYPSVADNAIEPGQIGINAPVRNKLGLMPEQQVSITEHTATNNTLSNVSINISTYENIRKEKIMMSFHEDVLKEKIKNIFNKYHFSGIQYLLLNMDSKIYIIQTMTEKEGYMTTSTNITIVSNDVMLNIVGSKLLKRDLFRDDYNFEEIGIGGLDKELLCAFRRALSTRAMKPSVVEKLGIKHVKGLLLFGNPGTGKTLIARKIGSMITDKEPKVVNGPEIMNKYVGQSEENIRNLFDDARQDYDVNKENAKLHVIIFDEIDAICKKRGGDNSKVNDTVVNQLLSMIDGVNKLENIFIIAMTNRKDLLDDALLRAGRIEVHIEIGLPNFNGRKQIFRIHTNKMQTNNMMDKNVSIDTLAKMTENYSGAEIETIVKNAGSRALHEQLISDKKEIGDKDIVVNMKHMLLSIEEVTPTFGNADKVILSLLPDKFIILSEIHKLCYDKVNEFMKKERRLKTVLIGGDTGTGKTCMALKIALDNKIKHTKIIRAIDMVSFDDFGKSFHIADIVKGSYISNESLIVIDDIEIAINYVKLCNSMTFSNKVYQTLMTLLKTQPDVKTNKLTLLVTCGDMDLYRDISKYFDMTFNIDKINENDVARVANELGYNTNMVLKYGMTIKELLNSV
jgi:vesicle-fusing ATPase